MNERRWHLGALVVLGTCYGRSALAAECAPAIPNDEDVYDARRNLSEATESLELAKIKLDFAQSAQLHAEPAAQANGQVVLAERVLVFNAAKREHEQAQHTFDCTYARWESSRRWTQGVGMSLSVAGAVDGTGHIGAALRYVSRYDEEHSWEVSLGAHEVRMRQQDSPLDLLTSLGTRLNFGARRTLFFFGVGAGALRDSIGLRSEHYIISGELGIATRFGNIWDPQSCGTPALDSRFFVQPWIPLDGSQFALLFGVEIGALLGFQPASPDKNLTCAIPSAELRCKEEATSLMLRPE